MRRPGLIVAWSLLVLPAADAAAQVKSFPYQAVVQTADVPVHSGPGKRYYETARLAKGSRLVVHRHDPGGWYMVAPPEGEYSLIQADQVRAAGQGALEVTGADVSVRVGSRLSETREVEQVRLARGDRVEAAAGVKPPDGWIAVRPPRGEYRWVPGQYVVPAEDAVRGQLDRDPFAVPSVAKRPERFDEPVASTPTADAAGKQAAGPLLTLGPPTAEPSETGDVAKTIRLLDVGLESLEDVEPTEWPLDELAREYRRLKETGQPGVARQIDARLAQIERMRVVQEHYSDYVRLTSATDARDAELLAKKASSARIVHAVPQGPQPTLADPLPGGPQPTLADAPAASPPAVPQIAAATLRTVVSPAPPAEEPPARPQPSPAAVPTPVPAARVVTPSVPASSPAAPTPPAAPAEQPRRFDAVGLIQAAVDPPPQAPRFVLVAPTGRILMYLEGAPGVPLEKFVGQPMGVDGQLHRHPNLTTPMIVVERLTPVRF